jgi:imidazolonepropionase-like amidohydrolase
VIRRALAILGLVALVPSSSGAQDVAVRGGIVHTAAGAPIADGVVLVRAGRIVAVGPAAEVEVPAGVRVLTAAVVTPGLVDAHSVVGLAGYLNTARDQEQLERSEAIQPELRAIDAYDPREPLIEWLRGFGVTTVHTGHAPGAVISGQTLIAKTVGDTVAEAVFVPYAMLACTLGEAAERRGEAGGSPGTRAKAAALLRAELVRAREYGEKLGRAAQDPDAEPPARELRSEALLAVLRRERPLLVTADRARDVLTALRIAREFDLRLVLDSAAEGHLVAAEIAAAGVPVIVHATMRRANGETENLTLEAAARLRDAGLRVALQSGYESYVPRTRVVLFEAAVAAANELGAARALESITLDAARILGVEGRVGSLEVGKDGDLALYDGDPFEYATHCVGVVIEGRVASETQR